MHPFKSLVDLLLTHRDWYCRLYVDDASLNAVLVAPDSNGWQRSVAHAWSLRTLEASNYAPALIVTALERMEVMLLNLNKTPTTQRSVPPGRVKLMQARSIVDEWATKQGHARCHNHNEILERLAHLLSVKVIPTPMPPREEMEAGCVAFLDFVYNQNTACPALRRQPEPAPHTPAKVANLIELYHKGKMDLDELTRILNYKPHPEE